MYTVYLGKVRLPVTPGKITMKIKNQNKTLDLINGSQVNILKQAGLTDIKFEALIPQEDYWFSRYKHGKDSKVEKFLGGRYFLEEFEKMKQSKKPVQFVVWREKLGVAHGRDKNKKVKYNKTSLFDTNMSVSLEDYEIKEDSENGFDLIVSFSLKKYVSYGTLEVVFKKPKENTEKPKVTPKKRRDSSGMKKPKTYKVKRGDCLWNLAKKFYDDVRRWQDIYDANKKLIEKEAKKNDRSSSSNGYWIYPGTELKLP